MRFVLVFALVFSTVFDVCMASSLFESFNVEVQGKDCCPDEANLAAESTEAHQSHDHEEHDDCQQCHTCQHVLSLRPTQNISSMDSLKAETPYQFFIPSTFIKSLKRPPKV